TLYFSLFFWSCVRRSLHSFPTRRSSDVVQVVVLLDVVGQDRQRVHVVDRPVKEALDLVGVQIHRDQAVRASGLEQVSDQAGGDWLAAAVLLVLAGVRVEREDRRDPLRRAALQG